MDEEFGGGDTVWVAFQLRRSSCTLEVFQWKPGTSWSRLEKFPAVTVIRWRVFGLCCCLQGDGLRFFTRTECQ